MSVTLETSQEPMSRLKLSAFTNSLDMSRTLEVSHSPMLLSEAESEEASSNIWDMLATSDRSGVSLASISRLEAPSKASAIDVH